MPVETPHPLYAAEAPAWEKVRDALGGERSVKAKTTKYLPSLEDQSAEEYRTYLLRAEWYGATKRTLDGLVGVVFRRPVIVRLGDAESLRPDLDRITRDGISLQKLADRLVREVVGFGRAGILVDRPVTGGDPYLALYQAETITNWQTRPTKSGDALGLVVLAESESVPKRDDPFVVESRPVFRELRMVDGAYQAKTWRRLDDDGPFVPDASVTPTLRGQSMPAIPFVFVNAYDTTPAMCRSPIEDIVDLNFHHYRAYADLQHGRHYTAMPTYYAVAPVGDMSGDGPAPAPFKVGPNRVWLVEPGADNRPGIIEFTGQGLIFLERATEDIERQMSVLGARLLATPRKTAAEAVEVVQMRERGEHSTLAGVVSACEVGLTEAVRSWVEWKGRDPSGVQVVMNRDFIETALQPRMISALTRAYERKLLPKTVVMRIFEEGDILPTGITADEALSLLKVVSEVYLDPKEVDAPEPHMPAGAETMPAVA